MKIEIHNQGNAGVFGNAIYAENKRISNKNAGLRRTDFSEDEIFLIIGEKNFEKYQSGQYIFDVPKWKIDVISGRGTNVNGKNQREILRFCADF